MRSKLIYSNFNKETGESVVTIKNKYGTFTGKAKLDPTDEPSNYHGCRIAEERAVLKCLKHRERKAKEKYDICQRFYDVIAETDGFDKSSKTANEMQRYVRSLKFSYIALQVQVETQQETIRKDIKERDEVLTHFKKYKKERRKRQ